MAERNPEISVHDYQEVTPALPLGSATLIQNSTTVLPKSDNKTSGQAMKNYKIPMLRIKCKFLDRQGIFKNLLYSIKVLRVVRYYELVHQIYEILRKEKRGINFSSVELYSETGYPLAPTPNIYFEPLSNWELRDNDLIYAYPKKLFNNYFFESNIDCEEFVISIQLKDSNIRKEFIFNKENISCIDLKIRISLDMHILTECISIHYFNLASQCEEVVPDNMDIPKETIGSHNLSFTISDTYFNNESRIQSVYTSCFPSSSLPKFHTLNADIQELVREYGDNRDKDKLLRKLGLLRKISCSPPLVYSLYLLFTQSPTSLPHRIATNEGIITTISLFSKSSDLPEIFTLSKLWMYIEERILTPNLQSPDIYETTFICKSMGEIDCKEWLLLIVTGKDKYGGYRQDLLENDLNQIEIDFCVCSKCNGVMRNACIVNGPDQKLVCEVCKMEGEDTIPMVKARKNISELRAKCPLLKRGCVWRGILGEIDVHLDKCANFILSCPKMCGAVLKRSELQNHCDYECQLRIVKCKYCAATVQYKEFENHYKICLEFPLLCPNKCLKTLIRKELKSHIEKECPNTLISCPYKEMGCEVLSKRSELQKHEKTFESKHFDTTKVFYLNKMKKMESIIQNQKDEINQLTAKVRNMEKECQRSKTLKSHVLAVTTPSVEVNELTEPIKVNSGPSEVVHLYQWF